MTTTPEALPTDLEDLRQYCAQLLAELGEKQQLIDKLSHQLALFRRYLYGRRSEQLDPAQLRLEFASWVQALQQETAPGPAAPAAPAPPRPRAGHGRSPLPALLPRRRVEHALPEDRCTCTACGAPLVKIGEETSEQLDYQPASLFVTEHVRFTYACHACEETVVTAELPAAPIEKGRPGPGLLAQVITAKYADHLPLNRQVDIFARHGVTLARQTLCDWVATTAEVLTPIYEDLKARVLTSTVIHTDDTGVPVLDRDLPQTRDGRLWVYVGDGHPADLVYDYTADRSRAGPLAFLGDFRGYLQADAYAGYDALYATGRVIEVGCWAHARRYFWDAKASDPARALPALGFIQQLYAVERDVKGADADTRRARRVEQALPVLARFRGWLDEQADVVLPKSPIGEAVGYARAQWTALTRYGKDGDLAIDNNVSERALRKVVTGRTNWLFCGSDAGGHRAAILLQPRGDVQGARDRSVGLSARRARADSHPSQSPPGGAAAPPLEGRADRDAVVTLRIPAAATADAARFLFFCPRRPLYLRGVVFTGRLPGGGAWPSREGGVRADRGTRPSPPGGTPPGGLQALMGHGYRPIPGALSRRPIPRYPPGDFDVKSPVEPRVAAHGAWFWAILSGLRVRAGAPGPAAGWLRH